MYSEEFLKALDLDPKVFNIGCDTESNSSESPNEPGRLIEGMDVIEHATVSHGCLDGCRLEDQEQANSDGELHSSATASKDDSVVTSKPSEDLQEEMTPPGSLKRYKF
jgi:hypothetical protein